MTTEDPRRAPGEELRRSSRLFLAELERLHEMEQRKSELPAGDAQRVALAQEIEGTTLDLVGLSRYQTRLIELEHQATGVMGPDPRPLPLVLEEWREAERRLHEARVAMERALDESDRLRAEHRQGLQRELGS